MYKLTVVGGPTRGSSFSVADGNVSIGRVVGNDIVLESNRVSKRHCVLVVDNTGVTVKDAGSSNGTFVNGVLAKVKKLVPGDRISVGEFILELTRLELSKTPRIEHQYSQAVPSSNVLPFPGSVNPNLPALSEAPLATGGVLTGVSVAVAAQAVANDAAQGAAGAKTSIVEKIKFNFEKYVINFLYNLNERHEWRSLVSTIFGFSVLFSIALSVYLVVARTDHKLQGEARGRAGLLARQIVDRNTGLILEQLESKTDVAFAEKERGVLAAYLVDMEGRVLAPGRKLNQYITEDRAQAAFAAAARKAFQDPERSKLYFETDGKTVAVAEPVRVSNPAQGKNVTIALGMVFFDQRIVTFDSGTEWMMFFNAAVLASIFAVAAYVSIYRLTLRPIQHLNDEVDAVLKGNAHVVTRKFKMSEMDSLVEVINAGLQRIGGGAAQPLGANEGVSGELALATLKLLAEKVSSVGVLIFGADKRLLTINATMEEWTGIRADSAMGGEIANVARESAFAAFIEDLLERAQPGSAGLVQENFDLSGVTHHFECHALGFESSSAKGYVLLAERIG